MDRAGVAGFSPRKSHVSWAVLLAVGLAGCAETPREATRAGSALELAAPATGRVVERDVPAPQVFQVTESGLWDGRPSLGGVWVAHPAAVDPERVLIRNTTTGAEVVGALFRRERENPGPRFQVSSEAAAALGILAGQPATLQVTALRIEQVRPEAPAAPAAPAVAATPDQPAAEASPAPTLAAAPVEGAEGVAEPRRGLRDIFRRRDAAPEPEAAPETAPLAAAAPAPQAPAGVPYDTVSITPVDAEPEAPRRGLRDLFRRRDAAPEDAPAISQTALAPVAPVASVAPLAAAAAPVVAAAPAVVGAPLVAAGFLSEGGDTAPARPVPVRASNLDEPGLIAPDAAAEAPRRGLRDLFRRREAEPAPAEPALIPLPAAAPAAVAPAAPAVVRAAAAPVAAATGATGAIDRPFVQVGIFAVEANAARTREQMRAAGLPAEVRQGRSGERTFWRVVVGPATNAASQSDLVQRTRALGFADAFAVRG